MGQESVGMACDRKGTAVKGEDVAARSKRAHPFRKKGSRERKAPAVPLPELTKVVSLSDAATPPKASQEEDSGPAHKRWRLGTAVVAVEHSGFSDDDDEGDDLFSDEFREKAFNAPPPQPHLATQKAAITSQELPAAVSLSSSCEVNLGQNHSNTCSVRPGTAHRGSSSASSHTIASVHEPPTGRAASPHTDVAYDESEEAQAEACSFEYDLPRQDAEDGQDEMEEDDDAQVDQGSQFHCYGDVAIQETALEESSSDAAIEETPSDAAHESTDKIESSFPDELEQGACSHEREAICSPAARAQGSSNHCGSSGVAASAPSDDDSSQEMDTRKIFFGKLSQRLSQSQKQRSIDAMHKLGTINTEPPVSCVASGARDLHVHSELAQPSGSARSTYEDLCSAALADGLQGSSNVPTAPEVAISRISNNRRQTASYKDIQPLPDVPRTRQQASRIHATDASGSSKHQTSNAWHASVKPAMLGSKHPVVAVGKEITNRVSAISGSLDDMQQQLQTASLHSLNTPIPEVLKLHKHNSLDADHASTRNGNENFFTVGAGRVMQQQDSRGKLPVASSTPAFVGFKTAKGRVLETKSDGHMAAHVLLGGLVNEMKAAVSKSADTWCTAAAIGEGGSSSALSSSKSACGNIGNIGNIGNTNANTNLAHLIASSSCNRNYAAEDLLDSRKGNLHVQATSVNVASAAPCLAQGGMTMGHADTRGKCAVVKMGAVDVAAAPTAAKGAAVKGTHDVVKETRQGKALVRAAEKCRDEAVVSTGTGHQVAEAHVLHQAGGAGNGVLGFRSGTGRSLIAKSDTLKNASSIFGTLLGDMQALQAAARQQQHSQHLQDADMMEVSSSKEKKHQSGAAQDLEQSVSGAAMSCDEPMFQRGTGRVVQLSQESMRSIAAQYGEKSNSSFNALHDNTEPFFSTGTGRRAEPSQQSLLRVQACYGDARLPDSLPANQETSLVGSAFVDNGFKLAHQLSGTGKNDMPRDEIPKLAHQVGVCSGGRAQPQRAPTKSFSYHLAEDGSGGASHGVAVPCGSLSAASFASFKTAKGKSLALSSESLKSATAIFGSLLGDLCALDGAVVGADVCSLDASTAPAPLHAVFAPGHLEPSAKQDPGVLSSAIGKIVEPSQVSMQSALRSYDGKSTLVTCAAAIVGNAVQVAAKDNDGTGSIMSAEVCPSRKDTGEVQLSLQKLNQVDDGADNHSMPLATASYAHAGSKHSAAQTNAAQTRSAPMAFDYNLAEPHALHQAGGAGNGVMGFRSGTGRSLMAKTDSLKNATSIFGSLLGDMQALQAATHQQQHSQDADMSEVSSSKGKKNLSWAAQNLEQSVGGAAMSCDEPMFQRGTGRVVQPSQESMRRVAAQYGEKSTSSSKGNNHQSWTAQDLEQSVRGAPINCDEPMFKKGTGRVVQPSQESMRSVAAQYGEKSAPSFPASYEDSEANSEPCFSTGTGRRAEPSHESMQQVQRTYGVNRLSTAGDACAHDTSPDDQEPVFSRGTGKVVLPSEDSMRRVQASYGDKSANSGECVGDSSGPVFSSGMGRIVEPSHSSLELVQAAYGMPPASEHLDDGPVFRKGTGKVVEPSQDSLMKVKASYGHACDLSTTHDVTNDSTLASPLVRATSRSMAEGMMLTPASCHRPLVPRFGNLTTSQALNESGDGSDASDPSAVRASTMGSRHNSGAGVGVGGSSGAKRPAANKDKRAFKVPRKLVAPPLISPMSGSSSTGSSSANTSLDHTTGTPLSAARYAMQLEMTGHDTAHEAPHTPGVMTSNTTNLLTASSGKALATPRHLFSPQTAMKISGFRVTNAALMDSSVSHSADSSADVSMLNVSLFNASVTSVSLDNSVNQTSVDGPTAPMCVNENTTPDRQGPDFFQNRLNEDSNESSTVSLGLQEAVEHAMPFEDWTNGNIQIKEYMKIRQISQHNALSFKFTSEGTQFFPLSDDEGAAASGAAVCAASGGGECAAARQMIGMEEMYSLLKARTQDTQESCPEVAWMQNHYKWIVWKLASMERAFPSIFGGRWLTPDRVMLQLLHRYDKEVLGSTRSVLLQIKQRDQMGSQHLVLCVSGIETEGEQVMLQLMDGWHSIQAIASPSIAQLTRLGKIFIGQKLRLYGSDTTQEEGKDAVLKISCNGARRAEWHAKLGAQTAPPPLIGIRTIKAGEGVVSAMMVVVQRVFPVVHMDSLPSGEKLWRSTKSEEAAQLASQNAQQDAWENFLAAQMKLENMEGDADSREAAQERQQKMEEWRLEFLKSQVERKVCSVMRIKVACLHPVHHQQRAAAEAYITFWRPQESIGEDVKEGATLELHNMAVAAVRKNECLCLSSMKGTKCRRLRSLTSEQEALVRSTYHARTFSDVSQLHRASVKQEVDIIGVVVAVSECYEIQTQKGPKRKQAIVLTCPPCPSALSLLHDDEVEEENYVVLRLDLTGLMAVKLVADRAGNKQPAVLAVQNINDIARANVRGFDAGCNVFTCSAFEDAKLLSSLPSSPAACNTTTTKGDSNDDKSAAEHWSRLSDWIQTHGATLGLATPDGHHTVLERRALTAQRILQILGQGV